MTRTPNIRQESDSYAVTAEFYDILQADEDEARVRRLYGREIAGARSGVLDIGAGTGRVTMLALADSWADVHAVEPARAMRTSLLTRLATLPAEQRDRVTVHPHPLDETALHAVADVAVCHNMIGCLPPAVRGRLWSAISRALTPGGSLFVQLPPARLPVRTVVRLLTDKRVGAHVYGGRMTMSAAGYRIRTRADYWVRTADDMLREHTETFWMWPATRARLVGELAPHGFVPLPGRADSELLAVALRGRR
ncbi:class I SAM-dependent methyltransferase [Streptomyces longispororuber]|uniref:class I SAM-dependent methyltransferase n=1 Tax=Streptomyces longispororuber TaxID=68230 RepID=UPI00210EE115|nr:class I SAM-dependent methyltransferase [Streptomyces longispororuber]MCQ4214090.1 class I SAM-dependent methyltransferase [Streptomyces longispororuber]